MTFDLYVCHKKGGLVRDKSGIVPLDSFVAQLEEKGGKRTDINPIILDPRHHQCHLICPEKKDCIKE